jgi:diaminohydroxyphosphoribosylaminopyrimidine deaminase / 5-amino-6-(5-phosphoribosylamino)uracil reductase
VVNEADYMDRALFLAARGRGRTSPNPMVGAVIVSSEGVIVGHGFHERAGAPHAEVQALTMAGAQATGGTMYCTLEPCCHQGRTGPCAPRIVAAGISRVVAATVDPNPVVDGRGFEYLRAKGVQVDVGLREAVAMRLNEGFFTLTRKGRPFVIFKAAISADGCIAAAPGEQTWLTSEAADRHAHGVRAEVDAIGVGVGTILIDDPLLTARGVYREVPLVRVIFDRRLRTPPAARVLSTPESGPVVIVTTADAAARSELRAPLEERGAEIEVARDGSMQAALERLATRKIATLLLEGGAAVHASAWDEGVVDYVRLYVTPHELGAKGLKLLEGRAFSSDDLAERRVEALGPDVLIEGYVHGPR